VIAATIEGAPNIAAIPAATPIIKPQETLPVKKPIPIEMMAKAAKAFPAFPVIIFRALHIVSTRTFELAEALVLDCAKAAEDKAGIIAGATAKRQKEKRATFAKEIESFFIDCLSKFNREKIHKERLKPSPVLTGGATCLTYFKNATEEFK
jgi:hypothetical protein